MQVLGISCSLVETPMSEHVAPLWLLSSLLIVDCLCESVALQQVDFKQSWWMSFCLSYASPLYFGRECCTGLYHSCSLDPRTAVLSSGPDQAFRSLNSDRHCRNMLTESFVLWSVVSFVIAQVLVYYWDKRNSNFPELNARFHRFVAVSDERRVE